MEASATSGPQSSRTDHHLHLSEALHHGGHGGHEGTILMLHKDVTTRVIQAALAVHSALGPGLLESTSSACHPSSTKSAPTLPIDRNFAYRCSIRSLDVCRTSVGRASLSARSTIWAAASGSACAPPTGSGTMASMRRASKRSGAVSFSAA